MMERFRQKINLEHLGTDLFLVLVSAFASLFLRVGFDEAPIFIIDFLKILPIMIVIRAAAFIYFDTHIIIWRYVSAVDAIKLTKAVLASSTIVVAITFLFKIGYIPRSVYFISAHYPLVHTQ